MIADKILALYDEKKEEYHEHILGAYTRYIKEVSSFQMAASLECCGFLMAAYDYLKPRNILDLGSGISSFVLRKFKHDNGLYTDIWSVDTDEHWLEKSKNFSASRGLDAENFYLWTDIEHKLKPFDLIFFDMDKSQNRGKYYDTVFRNCAEEGCVVIVDDYHKEVIRSAVEPMVEKYGFKTRKLKSLTDKLRRYQMVLHKRPTGVQGE